MIITEHFTETKTSLVTPKTADLARFCEERIRQLQIFTEDHWEITMRDVTLRYDLKGRTAGTANSYKDIIQINYILLKENTEHYIKQTLGHEYAHLITHRLYKLNKFYNRPTTHGRDWKNVMRHIGLKPDRCHNYDLTNVEIKRQKRWKYYCGCAKRTHEISTTIHNRINKGRKYRCRECGVRVTRKK